MVVLYYLFAKGFVLSPRVLRSSHGHVCWRLTGTDPLAHPSALRICNCLPFPLDRLGGWLPFFCVFGGPPVLCVASRWPRCLRPLSFGDLAGSCVAARLSCGIIGAYRFAWVLPNPCGLSVALAVSPASSQGVASAWVAFFAERVVVLFQLRAARATLARCRQAFVALSHGRFKSLGKRKKRTLL